MIYHTSYNNNSKSTFSPSHTGSSEAFCFFLWKLYYFPPSILINKNKHKYIFYCWAKYGWFIFLFRTRGINNCAAEQSKEKHVFGWIQYDLVQRIRIHVGRRRSQRWRTAVGGHNRSNRQGGSQVIIIEHSSLIVYNHWLVVFSWIIIKYLQFDQNWKKH